MKKKKIISSMLSLCLLCTMIMPRTTAYAENETSNSGMVINKTATANETDGTYTICLEAYATGSKIISETKKDKPTDIILVLDQSGSMVSNTMATESFTAYTSSTNDYYYANRHNGGNENLWHSLPDGSYASVSVAVTDVSTSYTEYSGQTNSTYYQNQNNLYVMNAQGEAQKVTVTYSYDYYNRRLEYTYSVEGETIATGYDQRAMGGGTTAVINPDVTFFTSAVDYTNATYTYTYTDEDGTHTITTSIGDSNVCDTVFYRRSIDNTTTRLDALKRAAETFVSSVAEKAKGADGEYGTDDDVSHRIAVVGFAHGTDRSSSFTGGYNYVNTELFIGATQYTYGVAATAQYGNAYQAMDAQSGLTTVTASISALEGLGATQVDLGMKMAEGILDANPVNPTERNQVVIVFTDGFPSTYSDYSSTVANDAISTAAELKSDGVTIYAIGVFEGADATSSGNSNGNNTQKANWFLQNLSNNNGTPPSSEDDDGYYLSAADAASLTTVFKQISNQIESGGSSTTLSEETVIKDIIAPQFTLPEGTEISDITLETYGCTGKTGDSYTWKKNNATMGATAAINGDQVSVTGFDFADNYVGTVTDNGIVSYRGNKLVISFNVITKAGFLGGNNVYTNTLAGVYENSDATTPVLVFNRPQVNVPIDEVSVSAKDKNVYLLGEITTEQLKAGAEISVGDVELNLAANNYGLEAWQNEYVNITITVKDASGNDVSDKLGSLEEDQKYYVYATVAPKTSGDGASGTKATKQSGSDNALINVFKPELTYKDKTVYYGEAVPTDFSEQLTSTIWKHTNTSGTVSQSTEVEMVGTRPELNLTYLAESQKTADGKINSKQDIGVKATVEINSTDITSKTWFIHTACADGSECTWGSTTPDGDPAFLLHPETCSLTITKTGGIEGEPYVFTVKKDDAKYSEVTIVGNSSKTICELPVGTYTIEEDTTWSWRHNPTYENAVVLSSTNVNGTIKCENTQNKPYWLNGFSNVVENIFGKNK